MSNKCYEKQMLDEKLNSFTDSMEVSLKDDYKDFWRGTDELEMSR